VETPWDLWRAFVYFGPDYVVVLFHLRTTMISLVVVLYSACSLLLSISITTSIFLAVGSIPILA